MNGDVAVFPRGSHLFPKVAAFITAGLVANLLSVSALVWLASPVWSVATPWNVLAIVNACMLLSFGLPYSMVNSKSALTPFQSDGLTLLKFARSDRRTRMIWSIAHAERALMEKGSLPASFDLDGAVEIAIIEEPIPNRLQRGCYNLALEAGRMDLARKILVRALDPKVVVPQPEISRFVMTRAVLVALEEGKSESLEALLPLVRAASDDKRQVRLLESVLALADGKASAAREALKEWTDFVASVRRPEELRYGNLWVVRMVECRLSEEARTAPPTAVT